MTPTERAELQARLVTLQARLAALELAYTASLAGGNKSYQFNSGVGSQSVERHNPKDLQLSIESTQAEIDKTKRLLAGTQGYTMSLRRTCGYGGLAI